MGYDFGAELSLALRIKFCDLLNQITDSNCEKIFKNLCDNTSFDTEYDLYESGGYVGFIYDGDQDIEFTAENVKNYFLEFEECEGFKKYNIFEEYIYLEPERYTNNDTTLISCDAYGDNNGTNKHITFNDLMSKMPQINNYIRELELVDGYEIVIKMCARVS